MDGRERMKRLWIALLTVGLLACSDPFGDLVRPVPEEPGEVTLWDFRTGPFYEPPAFNMLAQQRVRVDQTSSWDFLFFITEGGVAQFRAFTAVTGEPRDAALQVVEASFEDLREAPERGYDPAEPVSIVDGDVVAMVSRNDAGAGIRCRRFGKLEVLEIDSEVGTITFRYLINPNCELRTLVPGAR